MGRTRRDLTIRGRCRGGRKKGAGRKAACPQAWENSGRGRRVDHALDLDDAVRREAADLGVLADCGLVLREINAEGAVAGYIGLLPLHVRSELGQGRIRLGGGLAELLALQSTDGGDLTFNHKLAHCCLRWGFAADTDGREGPDYVRLEEELRHRADRPRSRRIL